MKSNIISSCNGSTKKPSNKVIELYKSVIDFDKLSNQLSMLPDLVRVAATSDVLACDCKGIKGVTTIRTICDMMNGTAIGKSMFTEVHKLLSI